MNKAPQSFWDDTNASFDFERPSAKDYTRLLINKHIPVTAGNSVIEIGCYPGRYLSIFGDLGYTLHGIDLTTRTPETKHNLEKYGYRVGEILLEDFLAMPEEKKYGVVASFGFIEHFENYKEIIDKHCLHVNTDGFIVIGAPNLKNGISNLFYRLFNSRGLKKHVLAAMDLPAWKEQLEKNGFDILFAGYCGGLHFWLDGDQSKMQHFFGLQLLRLVRVIKAVFFWINFENLNSKYVSCDFLVIGKKRIMDTR
ncbi:MAG: methyltransferase domain-containing protein [Ferruginibacter sp.]|nr:methyltransferase domain-containing protein [Ferruginibacter sp.]